MSHREQVDFCKSVKRKYPDHFKKKVVVDIGSLDINGNNRRFFKGCCYTGIDVQEGRNVDYIGPAHEMLPTVAEVLCAKVADRYRRRVSISHIINAMISTECLEHDKYWDKTLKAMYDHTAPGGLIVITAAGEGRDEHGTTKHDPAMSPGTNDYYQNITNEMFGSVLMPDMFDEYFLKQDPRNNDIQFYGIKKF